MNGSLTWIIIPVPRAFALTASIASLRHIKPSVCSRVLAHRDTRYPSKKRRKNIRLSVCPLWVCAQFGAPLLRSRPEVELFDWKLDPKILFPGTSLL